MTTYTVYNSDAGWAITALSLADAARERLCNDGGECRVVKNDNGDWELQVRKPNGGERDWKLCWSGGPAPFNKPIWVRAETEAAAFEAMAEIVRTASWNDRLEIMTDAEYQALLAEIDAEQSA